MREIEPTASERWFSRVVWLGIVANIALALPTLLAPEQMLAFARLPAATPLMWPRFAALLLLLLSAFYAPAALQPRQFRPVAWLTVAARLVGVVFFLGFERRDYVFMGVFDLVFLLPQAVLLAWSSTSAPAVASTGEPV